MMVRRIVERYSLARRVAHRFVEADTVGDPTSHLTKYRERLAKFAEFERTAIDLKAKLADILKLNSEAPSDPAAYDAWAVKIKALREAIPDRGDDAPGRARTFIKVYGFEHLKEPARLFCLSVIQQLVLSPKVRKSMEAAAKFWDKRGLRFKIKARISQTEAYNAEYIDRYLEELAIYRKYEALFILALKDGRAHSQDGEGATAVKAGPFTLINTGGFDADLVEAKRKLVEECTERMRHIGLGKVCYGNVLITNRISSQESMQAFYLIASDEMFIRADAKVTMDGVHAVCHELAHRYHNKFVPGGESNRDIKAIYMRLKNQDSDIPFPKIGEEVKYEGKTLRVEDYDFRRKTIRLRAPEEEVCLACGHPAEGHQPDAEHKVPIIKKRIYTMPLQMFNQLAGKPHESTNPLSFVTPYAEKGGPAENFAEMVAFYAMGKLPPEQVELLKPLL